MDIFGLEVSPGSICTFQENAYDRLASTEQAISDALKGEPIAGADEAGMRVAGHCGGCMSCGLKSGRCIILIPVKAILP